MNCHRHDEFIVSLRQQQYNNTHSSGTVYNNQVATSTRDIKIRTAKLLLLLLYADEEFIVTIEAHCDFPFGCSNQFKFFFNEKT